MASPPLSSQVAILDVEASGFGRDSYPIEVGYVLPGGTGFCTLIRPALGWTHWDESAQRVHQISRDTLCSHGRDVKEVAQLLNEGLQGLTVFSDGWAHDYSWLATLFEEAQLAQRFRLDSLRSLLTEEEAQRWHATKQAVSDTFAEQRHRASADARVLQLTLAKLRGAASP